MTDKTNPVKGIYKRTEGVGKECRNEFTMEELLWMRLVGQFLKEDGLVIRIGGRENKL